MAARAGRGSEKGASSGRADAAPAAIRDQGGPRRRASTAAVQQAAADFQQIAQAHLSVAVLVQQRTQKIAANSALLARRVALVRQCGAQAVGVHAAAL